MSIKSIKNNFEFTTIIWFILVILTLITFLFGWFKLSTDLFIGIILMGTFIKGQLVIDYFMELKHTRLYWRLIPAIWLILTLSAIAYTFLMPVK